MQNAYRFDATGKLMVDAALRAGGTFTGNTVVYPASGDCTAPVYREIAMRDKQLQLVTVEMSVRCRTCHKCLKARAAKWRIRALEEFQIAERVWFGTFTFQPHLQFIAKAEASVTPGFPQMNEYEQYRAVDAKLYKHVQLFFKRVRKNSGAHLRYILVSEQHKSGAVHFHALLFQVGEIPITWRVLADAWTYGFSTFKLADSKAVHYVVKYLTKARGTRVRASARLFSPASTHSEGQRPGACKNRTQRKSTF